MFKTKLYKKYVYKLVAIIYDDAHNKKYLINFYPKSKSHKLTFSTDVENMRGQLIINAGDFAISSVKCEITNSVSKERHHAKKQNHKQPQQAYWTNLPEEISQTFISEYKQDTIFKKYFLDYGEYIYCESGKKARTDAVYEFREVLYVCGLGEIKKYNEFTDINTKNFIFINAQLPNVSEFWNSFRCPCCERMK